MSKRAQQLSYGQDIKDIKGMQIPAGFSSWKSILKQWIHNILNVCKEKWSNEYDAPYWYNERATLSTFAAAVWQVGGIALEEYRADKGSSHIRWKGRVDLAFNLRRKTYAIEAKQLWFNLGEDAVAKRIKKGLRKKVKAAVFNARDVQSREGERIALVFVVPYIKYENKSDKYDLSLIHSLIEEIHELAKHKTKHKNYLNGCLVTWCFPKISRRLKDTEEKRFYPGVILVARKA